MRYLYGAADEKFVRRKGGQRRDVPHPLHTYTYRLHPLLAGKRPFDKNDIPIEFKTSPDTLLHYASKVIDAFPISNVYNWTDLDVCRWLRNYGFPDYQITFRKNLITGRKLLLLDASALSAMNIKDFDHIRQITYGIRQLFYFEMTRFIRSISLAPEYHYELYKVFLCQTGMRHESTRRTALWREMQLQRDLHPNFSHWELLERWMARIPDKKYPELFGGILRPNLYKCKKRTEQNLDIKQFPKISCNCMPPCECYWTADRDTRQPWRLSELPPKPFEHCPQPSKTCKCMPPCTCRWRLPARVYTAHYMLGNVLTILQQKIPSKYDPLHYITNPHKELRDLHQHQQHV